MSKNEATVKAVIEASKEILASKQGKMSYQDWRAALTAKVGSHDQAAKHIAKNNLVLLWLSGFDAEGKPILMVVSDKSMMADTGLLVDVKGLK